MSAFLHKLLSTLFGKHLELRVRLFNILACAGLVICVISAVTGIIINAGIINLLSCVFLATLTVSLLWYSSSGGSYQICYIITVIIVFFIAFPVFFIFSGGYAGGMPVFFVFAVLFTVFMLEGKRAVVFTAALLALYASLIIFAYLYPGITSSFDSETDRVVDITVAFLVVSGSLAITVSLQLQLYKKQQTELEAARKQAEEFTKMNSELFAAMSHEMRTPLTVMSTYAQFAVEQIKEKGANEQTLRDLEMISDEAKRLAKMADGTLKVLLSSTQTGEESDKEIITVDIGELTERLVQLTRPVVLRKNQEMSVFIADHIPKVRGETGELTQLLWNVLQNAITHSRTCISLSVKADDNGVLIEVEDDGVGIEPEFLPRIFEWGVSGNEEGTGVGLSICRDIADRYNGKISIKSEINKGTLVKLYLKGRMEEK